jgi:hypothetical protein
MKENLVRPEHRVDLFAEEVEILLEDVHQRIAKILHYIDLGDRVIKGNLINTSCRRRIITLRNLAAKLELSLNKKETTKELDETTRNLDRGGGDHSADRNNLLAEEPGEQKARRK